MGHCCSKNIAVNNETVPPDHRPKTPHYAPPSPPPASGSSLSGATPGRNTPAHSFSTSPFPSPLPPGVAPSPAKTPGRKFRWPLPPPSPAKPIMAALLRRQGKARPKEGPIPEEQGEGGGEGERSLDKSFGYGKNFGAKFELGKEVGRGHFGHTCWAKGKKGELKGQSVAVKIISKAKVRGFFVILLYNDCEDRMMFFFVYLELEMVYVDPWSIQDQFLTSCNTVLGLEFHVVRD